MSGAPENDVVVLHVCCHNPTGVDLSADQWREVAAIAARRRWIPFFDFAYQGFGAGLEADRAGLLPFLETGLPESFHVLVKELKGLCLDVELLE